MLTPMLTVCQVIRRRRRVRRERGSAPAPPQPRQGTPSRVRLLECGGLSSGGCEGASRQHAQHLWLGAATLVRTGADRRSGCQRAPNSDLRQSDRAPLAPSRRGDKVIDGFSRYFRVNFDSPALRAFHSLSNFWEEIPAPGENPNPQILKFPPRSHLESSHPTARHQIDKYTQASRPEAC
jgi:hypothetical protein